MVSCEHARPSIEKNDPWGTRSCPCCPRRLLLQEWHRWRRRAWLTSCCCCCSRASCKLDHHLRKRNLMKLEQILNHRCCRQHEDGQRQRVDFHQLRLGRSRLETAELGDRPFHEKTAVIRLSTFGAFKI